MAVLPTWDQFKDHVQQGMRAGLFSTAEHVAIAAGPPFLDDIGGINEELSGGLSVSGNSVSLSLSYGTGLVVYPLGLLQQVALGQNTNLMRLFEVGSKRSYFVSGRTVGQLSVRRAYYHSVSLMRALYAFYYSDKDPNQFPALAGTEMRSPSVTDHPVWVSPGYRNMWLNLASDLFHRPVGLLLVIRDNAKRTLGMLYFEQCYVPTLGITFDSASVLLQEQITIQYERIIPIPVTDVDLLSALLGT